MAFITDNATVEGLLDTKSFRTQAVVQATSASTLALTSASEHVAIFTGVTVGQIVSLPSALTLQVGHQFRIYNNSTQIVTLNNFSAVLLTSITPHYSVYLTLQDNLTAAGVWVYNLVSPNDVAYIPVTNETEFLAAIIELNAINGGTIHITNTITLTANRTIDLSNIRVVADTSVRNGFVMAGFVMTLTGSGAIFQNCRWTGSGMTAITRSQLFMAITGTPTPNFIWFDNCMFKNLIGGVYPNTALSPSGVSIDLTAAGANFTNIIFENCNASQDWYTPGGTYPVGLCVWNCHGATNKYVTVTGHVGQTEGRNRFILAPLQGTPNAGTYQAFITDGSGAHNGPFEVPSLGTNYYSHSINLSAVSKFLTPASGSVLSLEPESPFNSDNAFCLINATTATQSVTLPPTPNYADGARIYFHKNGLYSLVLVASGTDTVNGAASYTCRDGNELDIVATFRESTADWYIQEMVDRNVGTVATTNATATTLYSMTLPTDSVTLVEAKILGKRTGGTAGANGDCATYILRARYKNVGGTVTQPGGVDLNFSSEDVAGYGATLNFTGTTARVQVTGIANTNITWFTSMTVEVVV
jgi:hypothetical protein